MDIADWERHYKELTSAPLGDAADDLIDSMLNAPVPDVSGADSIQDAEREWVIRFWHQAVSKATSTLSRRDAVRKLAEICAPEDEEAAELLGHQFEVCVSTDGDKYLAPHLLQSLFQLSKNNEFAKTETLRALQRLKPDADRYLLIRAAKIIGTFEAAQSNPTISLRRRLGEWEQSEDLAVSAEAHFQTARLALGFALRSDDFVSLYARLTECQAAFHRAELSEEVRNDARVYGAVVELLRAYCGGNDGFSSTIEDIQQLCTKVEQAVYGSQRTWHGMSSQVEDVARFRVLSVARTMAKMGKSLSHAEQWTNFDEVLTELAALCLILQHGEEGEVVSVDDPFHRTNALATHLFGPLIERAVTRVRFAKVIEKHVASHGEDPIALTLRGLYSSASTRDYGAASEHSTEGTDTSFQGATTLPEVLQSFLAQFPEVRRILPKTIWEDPRLSQAFRNVAEPLPIDNPNCYGNDRDVDLVAREVFQHARHRLGPGFPRPAWGVFQQVVVFLTQTAYIIRDDPPKFALCVEDDGSGPSAREKDLQEYLRPLLKLHFGRAHTYYEEVGIAGGRVDMGVRYDECDIPIEVKAEHKHIERTHIRTAFLKQADDYATARNRLSCLLILDVRDDNLATHRKRVQANRSKARATPKSGKAIPPGTLPVHKLYSLRDSFWIDGLEGDPQITAPELNAVLVGLIPANRALPSSTSHYSRP